MVRFAGFQCNSTINIVMLSYHLVRTCISLSHFPFLTVILRAARLSTIKCYFTAAPRTDLHRDNECFIDSVACNMAIFYFMQRKLVSKSGNIWGGDFYRTWKVILTLPALAYAQFMNFIVRVLQRMRSASGQIF